MVKKALAAAAIALTMAISACAHRDITNVPTGARVEITRQDGGVTDGTLLRIAGTNAVIAVGTRERTIPVADVVSVRVLDANTAMNSDDLLPPAARFREYLVPGNVTLTARLDTAVASDANHSGDPVRATLAKPVMVNGTVVLPVGTLIKGTVDDATASGRVKGRARLAVRFTTLTAHDGTYAIDGHVVAEARATKGRDTKTIGLPAAGGAIIGGLLGGKKGALAGAAIGGGAGTAVVLSTPGQNIRWRDGRTLSFSLGRDINVRVPITPRERQGGVQ